MAAWRPAALLVGAYQPAAQDDVAANVENTFKVEKGGRRVTKLYDRISASSYKSEVRIGFESLEFQQSKRQTSEEAR